MLCIAFPAVKVIGALSVKTVVCRTAGCMSVD